jgi:hypothetical protein
MFGRFFMAVNLLFILGVTNNTVSPKTKNTYFCHPTHPNIPTMKSIYTALLLLLSLSVQAQHKPYNRAFLSYGQQYYFNKSYVLNDDKEPNPLRPHNTYGYNVGLNYERVTRSGLLFNAGLQYGLQRHNVDFFVDLANFDATAARNLRGAALNKNISCNVQYAALQLMVGYIKEITPKWSVTGKAGFMLGKMYTSGMHETIINNIQYVDDIDPLKSTIARVAVTEVLLGARKKEWSWAPSTLEFYVGAVRAVNVRWLKSVALGVEGSFSPFNAENSGDFIQLKTRNSVLINSDKDVSIDKYYNRSRAIGIRLGLGLG